MGGGRGVSRKNVILTFDPNYHPYLKVLSIGISGKIERCSWVVLKGIPHKAEFKGGLLVSRGYGSTNMAATSRSSLSSSPPISPLSQRAVYVLLLVGWGVRWDNKQGETGQSHSLYVCFCLVRTWQCIWASVLASRSVFECVCYLLARTLASMCELRLDCDRPPSSHNSSPTVRENNCYCSGPIPKITKKRKTGTFV